MVNPCDCRTQQHIGHNLEASVYEPLDLEGLTLRPGNQGDAVTRLQRTLRNYGYGIEETGHYDDATRIVVTAFQRHFRPARIDGIGDPSTLLTLRALIETRPEPLA